MRFQTLVLAASLVRPVTAQVDLQGIWNSATATPLERPRELGARQFFSPEEAAVWESHTATANEESERHSPGRGTGTYNTAFREFGVHVVKTLRTSIVIDPADGRIPASTPAAAQEKQRRQEALRHPSGIRDLGLQDRCLAFSTAIPPMLPYSYNSNYQIVQTPGEVMIHVEMGSDTRIISLERHTHLPASVRLWLGDSIGRWEGRTLVVDTTNFNDAGGYFGDAGGMFGSDRNLHVVERFSLFDAGTILYQFEVEDPTAFTRPWKGELTMARAAAPIYEYACHEGNYSIPVLLGEPR